ncbi:MAG: right-handed parallel beta-helix repeat-containing protein [Anaerolineae bacterium]|nr:right-handed parallel beta-helix repeat-containing protein [Anaerolineae bacterium]
MTNRRSGQKTRLTTGLAVGLGQAVIVLALLLLFPAQPVHADTNVCGSVNGVWTLAASPYIVTCTVKVLSGQSLTIQSGVTVKFNAGTSLTVEGTLVAQNCTFTSSKAIPGRNNWGQIYFASSSVDAVLDANGNYLSGSAIQNCVVEWGGLNVNGAIETNVASPFLAGNTVRNNGSNGINALGRSTSQPISIKSNSISGNISDGEGTVWDGGGIYVYAGKVISNTVQGNKPYVGDGGGIYAKSSTVTGNNVIGNSNFINSEGAGIYALGSAVSHNTVSGNNAGDNGGGIYASAGTVADNIVTGNVASWGGGIYVTGLATVIGNTVSGNSAISQGGGIYADGGIVSGNNVSGNAANLYYGGGIYAQYATVTSNTITNNSAPDGGAIYGYQATITSNTVMTNTTTQNGTIYMDEGSATLNNITGNQVGNYGGGLFGDNANLTSNTVKSNSADSGGGIYAINNTTINGNSVMSNTVQAEGGGIYANGSNVINNTIQYNSITAFGSGSGLYVSGNQSVNNNSVIENVSTGGTAGGISIHGQPHVQYNNLYGNQPYDAEVISADNVCGTRNYWGTTSGNTISGHIYDGNDAPNRGILLYNPFLNQSALPGGGPVALLPCDFEKNSPPTGATQLPTNPTLSWGTSLHAASYEYCYDTTNNSVCDAAWTDAGNNTTAILGGLAVNTTYYWQVRARNAAGTTPADAVGPLFAGTWWSFTTLSSDLLSNPGFELDANSNGIPDNWGKNAKFKRTNKPHRGGQYAGNLSATDDKNAKGAQKIPNLSAGLTYGASCWVKIPKTLDTFTFKVQVIWLDSLKKKIRTDDIGPTFTGKQKKWAQAAQDIVAPPGTASAKFVLAATSLNATILVDDCSFAQR